MASTLSRAIDALSDPGRREVLEQLALGPRTATELAASLAAPGPVLSEWLETLAGAGLVARDGASPLPTYQVNAKGVEELRDYLERIANLPSAEVSGVPVSRQTSDSTDPGARFSVRREVELHRSQAQTFQLFTAGMGEWWPLGRRHFSPVPAVTVILEAWPGGRWFERGDDGSEFSWGEILVWEPPRRVVLSWRVGPNWEYDPIVRTEVEVTFVAAGPGSCLLQLEHRCLDQLGGEAARLQATFDGEDGWTALLRRFTEIN